MAGVDVCHMVRIEPETVHDLGDLGSPLIISIPNDPHNNTFTFYSPYPHQARD